MVNLYVDMTAVGWNNEDLWQNCEMLHSLTLVVLKNTVVPIEAAKKLIDIATDVETFIEVLDGVEDSAISVDDAMFEKITELCTPYSLWDKVIVSNMPTFKVLEKYAQSHSNSKDLWVFSTMEEAVAFIRKCDKESAEKS